MYALFEWHTDYYVQFYEDGFVHLNLNVDNVA